jgi:hypothetical protein
MLQLPIVWDVSLPSECKLGPRLGYGLEIDQSIDPDVAIGKLSSILEDGPKASVSVTWVGNCEVRMFRGPETDFDNRALFWLELFDHGTRMSVDGFRCLNIKDAAPAFDILMSQLASLNNPDPSGAEAQ